MNKIEKQIINAKRQLWQEEKKAEFKALFPDLVEKSETDYELEQLGISEIEDEFTTKFNEWLNELEQYEVVTQDEDGKEVVNKYSRKLRPMPNFTVTNDGLIANEAYKKQKLILINKEYEEQVAELTKGIPSTERSTWIKQEVEARAYLADNNADVPFIRTLAESRGVPLDYLANKIIEKAYIFSVESGKLTGEKQRKEDMLKG